MAETSYPVADGGAVTEFDYEELMGQALGEGRVDGDTWSNLSMVYADSTGRHVKVRAGTAAIVRGFRYEAGSEPVIVPLEANTSGLPRVDLIVLRLDRESYAVRAVPIKGNPASNPVAPAPLRQITEVGKFDVPIASVRVVSNATTGQPSIAASDVTALDKRVAPRARIGTTAQMRTAGHPVGTLWTEYDQGMVWANAGTSPILLGEKGNWTKIAPAVGWDNDSLYAIRRNGWTYFQGWANWNGTPRSASAVTLLCVLPDTFRPTHDVSPLAMITPTQLARFYIDATTGRVELRQFAQTFPTGGGVVLQGQSWVSKGV